MFFDMSRRLKVIIAFGVGIAALTGGTVYAHAQGDEAAQLRASGQAGEQWDGYMGVVDGAPADVRARVDAINIRRRAIYTERAAARQATIEAMAASAGCELLSSRVGPGQYYRLPDGVWRKREGNAPVPLPSNCPS